MKLPITRGVYYYRVSQCTIDPLLAKYPHVMSANRRADVFAWLMCTRSAGYTHSKLRVIKFTTAERTTIKAYHIIVALDGESANIIMAVGRRGDLRKYMYGKCTGYHGGKETHFVNYITTAHRVSDSLAEISSSYTLDITPAGDAFCVYQWAAFFSKDVGDVKAHMACNKCMYPMTMIEC